MCTSKPYSVVTYGIPRLPVHVFYEICWHEKDKVFQYVSKQLKYVESQVLRLNSYRSARIISLYASHNHYVANIILIHVGQIILEREIQDTHTRNKKGGGGYTYIVVLGQSLAQLEPSMISLINTCPSQWVSLMIGPIHPYTCVSDKPGGGGGGTQVPNGYPLLNAKI